MSVVSAARVTARKRGMAGHSKAPFLSQLALITWRSLVTTFRQPAQIIPGVFLGVFFTVMYDASLSGAASFFLQGQSYLGFLLPLSVISAALTGAGVSGDAIMRDIKSGYFDKMLLTPVSRPALLLGPIISAAVVVVIEAIVVIATGLVLGLKPVTGVAGLLVLLGFSLLFGLALAGFVAGIALWTNSTAATASASFLLFPLTFLTSAFAPLELLTGWIRTFAPFNPVTYLLDATRAILNTGWNGEALAKGLAVLAVMFLVTFSFAFLGLRARTRRR